LAVTAAAQSQTPDQNPNPNVPVVISPDVQVQPQPSADSWDRWGIQKVSPDDDWTRHFRIGAMVGLNISANFSMKGKFTIPGNNTGIYDDGYVRVDDTGNAQGYTSYWGYNNQSQLGGSTLTMHSTTSYSASGSSEESGSAFPGFEMAYGGNLWDWGRTRIGWDLGFGLVPINITDNQPITGVSVKQTVHQFNTGTINVPSAPYQGPYNSAGNPTIFSNFTSYNTTNSGTITGSHTLDVMLYTVRLGPSLYWDLNKDFGLSVGVGPAVGIVSGSLKYNEMITTTTSASSKGQVDATDLVYGGYANAMLLYHVPGENGDLYLGAQFMSLGNATISGGGRQGQLNLGGQIYITAGINWPF
jgi:hypothetical protein